MDFKRNPCDIQFKLFFQLIDNTLADIAKRSDVIGKDTQCMFHGVVPYVWVYVILTSGQCLIRIPHVGSVSGRKPIFKVRFSFFIFLKEL
jgi:hypothetical protein